MSIEHPRLRRERRTIQSMLVIYCRAQHNLPEGKLCPECQMLEEYALGRLAHCPFQENKPVCARCTVHCYKPEMRQRMRGMMRFAGPRMLLRHPVLAILHLLDERHKPPALKRRQA